MQEVTRTDSQNIPLGASHAVTSICEELWAGWFCLAGRRLRTPAVDGMSKTNLLGIQKTLIEALWNISSCEHNISFIIYVRIFAENKT